MGGEEKGKEGGKGGGKGGGREEREEREGKERVLVRIANELHIAKTYTLLSVLTLLDLSVTFHIIYPLF